MNNLAPVREQTGIRHFIDLRDLDASTLRAIIDVSASVKRMQSGRKFPLHPKQPFAGRSLGLMLEKPSTRTRISFEVGMGQLGGRTLILSPADMQVGRGESLADTARVLSRFLDALVIRTGDVETLREIKRWSSIPVINGLTPDSHPVQILADIMTFEEHRGPVAGTKWAWVGDGNNVATSLIEGAVKFDFSLDLATPPTHAPRPEVLDWARREGGRIRLFHNPEDAVKNADCIVTDTWTSMSDTDSEERLDALRPFQVSRNLMSQAASGALFMHCLPAHVGEEVSLEVFESAASVVFDEAENRLHAQKGLLLWCLGGEDWTSAGLAS
ncbi:Ornithine carbamoyltransferase [Acetobacteraceae bacterium EV16G]|uniref:Ornithine carbamoyltransferase n=1 Tax=Sorlinia euscelidii TaxID=3081148 RepID=A0ABU7U0R3_9PROT